MADSDEVEKAAQKVSRQSVQLKFQGKTFPDLQGLCNASGGFLHNEKVGAGVSLLFINSTVLFINETDFPMRIVSGTVGWPTGNLEFQQDVDPHSYFDKVIWSFTGTFSTGGYIKIAYDEKLSSKEDPNEGNVFIIEFALSSPYAGSIKINIQDKTNSGRTQGEDTHKTMTNDERKTLYWKKRNVHYLARAEVLRNTAEQIGDWIGLRKFNLVPYTSKATGAWCFIIQDFDPEQDLVENEK